MTPDGIRVKKSAMKGIEIDMNRTPDALPAMAVTAAFADGTTRLVNVPQARKKGNRPHRLHGRRTNQARRQGQKNSPTVSLFMDKTAKI